MRQWFHRFSEFSEFSEFNESSAPLRENLIVLMKSVRFIFQMDSLYLSFLQWAILSDLTDLEVNFYSQYL